MEQNINEKRRTIVFVSYTAGRDGATRVMSLLMNHYIKEGCRVYFVVRDIFQNIDLDNGVEVIELGKNEKFGKVYFIKWLHCFLLKVKPERVVSFLLMPNVITLIASFGTKTKVVISERNDPTTYKLSYKILSRVFYGFADKMVFQTKRVLNLYPKRIQKKGVIIHNPVEVKCEAISETRKITAAGRLEHQKNQKMLINAFAKYLKSYPDVKLYIYGEGTLRKELERQIESLNIHNSVFLPGNVDNIHECIKDSLFYVLSSNYEGLSNSLMEAMLMGLPCISTNCAGSDEIIETKYNGILVEVGNEDQLYRAMCDLTNDVDLRRKIRINAKKSMSENITANIIGKWDSVLIKDCKSE